MLEKHPQFIVTICLSKLGSSFAGMAPARRMWLGCQSVMAVAMQLPSITVVVLCAWFFPPPCMLLPAPLLLLAALLLIAQLILEICILTLLSFQPANSAYALVSASDMAGGRTCTQERQQQVSAARRQLVVQREPAV
jgi:hypothetical protein